MKIVKTHFNGFAQSLRVGVSLGRYSVGFCQMESLFYTMPILRALIVKTSLRGLLNPTSKDWR